MVMKETKNNEIDRALRLGCQTAVLGPGVKVRIINVLGRSLLTPSWYSMLQLVATLRSLGQCSG